MTQFVTHSFDKIQIKIKIQIQFCEKNNLRIRRANGNSVHEACQAVVKFRGRLAEWIADIRQAQKRKEDVLFVASTAGTAQRVIELLNDYGVEATAVDSTNDDQSTTAVGVVIGQTPPLASSTGSI